MKTRAVIAAALLILPVDAFAQIRVRIPRAKNPFPTTTREIPASANAMRMLRSRWSTESYTVAGFAPGGRFSSTGPIFGSGALHAFRSTERLWLTVDLTAAGFLQEGAGQWTTTEIGVRYGPPIVSDRIRPFVDARALYMAASSPFDIAGRMYGSAGYQRSRGIGLLGGVGAEVPLSASLALTAQFGSSRQLLSVSSSSRPDLVARGHRHWSTHHRMQLGLRFNRARIASLAQNPGSR